MSRLMCVCAAFGLLAIGGTLVRADERDGIHINLDSVVQVTDGLWITQSGDGRVYGVTGNFDSGYKYYYVHNSEVPVEDQIETTQYEGTWDRGEDNAFYVFAAAAADTPKPAGPPNNGPTKTTEFPMQDGKKVIVSEYADGHIVVTLMAADGKTVISTTVFWPEKKK